MQNFIPSADDFSQNYIYPFSPLDTETVKTKFEPALCERDFRPLHAKDIKEAMLKGAYIPPITVNIRNCHIIDGQHRWRAWLDAVEEGYLEDLNVSFVDVDEEDEYDIFRYLNSGIAVNGREMISSANKTKKRNVSILYDFAMRHEPLTYNKHNGKIKPTVAECLIFGARRVSAVKKYGDYECITDDMLKYADLLAEEVKTLLPLLDFDKQSGRDLSLICAWFQFRRKRAFANDYRNSNAIVVDNIGFEAFAKEVNDYIFKKHGRTGMKTEDWMNAFWEVTERHMK